MRIVRKQKPLRNTKGALRRAVSAVLATAAALGLSACSGDMFSSGGDDKLQQAPSYRKINPTCNHVDLSSRSINPAVFRALIKCFNAHGALEPLEKLISETTDGELAPITDVINRYLLENPSTLYQIENTLHAIKDNGVLDQTLLQVGRLFENPRLITSLIAALEEGGSPELLRAAEQTATGMTPSGMVSFLDASMSIADSHSFKSLQEKLRIPTERSRGLDDLSQRVHDFLQNRDGAQKGDVGRELLRAAMSGQLFNFWDGVMGSTDEQLLRSIPRHTAMMKVLLADDGKMLKEIASLHHFMEDPLVCLNGGKQVPDLHLHLLREISLLKKDESPVDYMARVNLLTILAVKPFCQFPKELATYYPALIELANSTAAMPAIEVLKGLYHNNLARPVLGFSAGTGPEDKTGFMLTVPIFSEITERDAWADLMLALTVIHPDDRAKLANSLGTMATDESGPGVVNAYDVAINALGRVSPATLQEVFSSVSDFFHQDEPFLVPVFKALRSSYFANDAHPFIDLGLRFARDATEHQPFFTAVGKLSRRRHFPEAMSLISRMSKDGSLKELLQAGVTLFHKSSLAGKVPMQRLSEPVFVPKRTHNMRASQLAVLSTYSISNPDDPCLRLRIDLPFEDQITDYMKCANRDGKYDSLQKMFKILNDGRTSDGSRSYLAIPMDLINRFEMKGEEAALVIDSWLRSLKDGSFKDLMEIIPAAITERLQGNRDLEAGPLMKPLLELNRAIVKGARFEARRVMDAAADLMSRPEVPAALRYAEKVAEAEVRSLPESSPKPINRELVRRWVKEVECPLDQSRAGLERRVNEVIAEYRDSVVGWDLLDGKPRQEWKASEFKAEIAPLIAEFGDPSRSAGNKTLTQAAMNVMRYFSLKPGQKPNRHQHYTPEYLAEFLKTRSEDLAPISYFYPGERTPRLRLVSTLDRLEIVLLGADFKFMLPENFALKFLAIIGKAWGDEKNPQNWPEDIRAEYHRTGVYPQTLREAYGTILETVNKFESLIRYPKVTRCGSFNDGDPGTAEPEIPETRRPWIPRAPVPFRVKAAFYNIKQVLSVLEENLPQERGYPSSPMAGGMLPFRDLFYEFYTSSKPVYRNARAERGNHLSVVTRIVRLGLTRQLTRQLARFNTEAEMAELSELLRGLAQAAQSPDVVPVLQQLLSQKDAQGKSSPKLIFGVLDEVFKALEKGPAEAASLKQLFYYGLIDAGRLDLIEPLLKSMNAVLSVPGNLEFASSSITENASKGWITAILTSPEAARVVRVVHDDRELDGTISPDLKETAVLLRDALSRTQQSVDLFRMLRVVDADQKAMHAMDEFIDRARVFADLPAVSSGSVKTLAKDLYHFFAHRSSDGNLTREQTADTIRRFAAGRIRSATDAKGQSIGPGEAEEFMLLAARDPEAFYQLLVGLSDFTRTDGMNEFLEMFQRALSSPR